MILRIVENLSENIFICLNCLKIDVGGLDTPNLPAHISPSHPDKNKKALAINIYIHNNTTTMDIHNTYTYNVFIYTYLQHL